MLMPMIWLGMFAQDSLTNLEAIKLKQRETYIYNFTKYIDWENLESAEKFTIGVFHSDEEPLVGVLRKAYEQKKIKGKPVEVLLFNSLNEIEPTDMLYLNVKSGVKLEQVLPTLYENNTLLISEGFPFHQSMVNFIVIDGEFHFEINEEKINRAKLLVDPALQSFSIQSTADWEEIYDQLQAEISINEAQKLELEKLTNEILSNKEELLSQEERLRKTLEDVNAKKRLLELQDSTIKNKNGEISSQLSKLNKLNENVQNQLQINAGRSKVYEIQEVAITEQNKKLQEQEAVLLARKTEIEEQEKVLVEQQKKLSEQRSKLDEQRIAMYAFVALIIFAAIFLYFMYKSNRKRMESEKNLVLKNEELTTLNESLDSFTYRVSHDLKAPVVNVKNMVGMLEDFTKDMDNAMIPKIVSNLSLSANRLETTLLDMIQLTKIERVDETKDWVSLRAVFESLVPDYLGELETIKGEIDISELGNDKIFASDVELKSVFQNLITNSIKYRSKQNLLKINVKSEIIANKLILTYADNGMGIDLKKHEKKLFNMFVRFTSDKNIAGTGVGMFIIKKLIEKNNGTIEMTGAPEKGLTYTFEFSTKQEKNKA